MSGAAPGGPSTAPAKPRWGRIALGLVAAIQVPAVAVFPLLAGVVKIDPGFLNALPIGGGIPREELLLWGLALYAGTAIYSATLALLIAVPMILLCRYLDWQRGWAAALAGAVIGVAGLLRLMKLMFNPSRPWYDQLDLRGDPRTIPLLLATLAVGAAAGLVYWRIVHVSSATSR